MIRAILFALAMSCMTGPADAEAPLTALARVEPGVSGVFDARGGLRASTRWSRAPRLARAVERGRIVRTHQGAAR